MSDDVVAAGAPASPPGLGWWWLFYLAPGLGVASVASLFYLFNDERTTPEAIAVLLAWLLLAANAVVLAPGRVRRFLRRERWAFVVSAAALVLSLAAGEVFLQHLVVPPPLNLEGSIFRPDEELGFDLVPNTSCRQWLEGVFDARYTVNAQGTRGAAWREARPGRRTVLALGCSQTFGHGVNDDEAWPAQLEMVLGDDWRVINGGVPAYGPQQAVLRARRLAAACEPDVILLGVGEFQLVRLGFDAVWNANIGNFGLRLPIVEENAAGEIVVSRLVPEDVVPRDQITVFSGGAVKPDRGFQLQLVRAAKGRAIRLGQRVERWLKPEMGAPPPMYPASADAWRVFDLSLRELARLAHDRDATAIVFFLPEPRRRDTRDYKRFREHVEKSCESAGVACLDITSAVIERAGTRTLELNRFYEPHFTPRTQRAIAESLQAAVPEFAAR